MSKQYDYDAIIIGAGISGLVCGCYLAKAGLKTLIIEKNATPGGYCTSFRRNNIHFDACVHALSSLRKGGILHKILSELSAYSYINFKRSNPTDIIISPRHRINFYNDTDKTIADFIDNFPNEHQRIISFFEYIKAGAFLNIRTKTFHQFLEQSFKNQNLKAILSIITLQLLGLPSHQLSALVACLLFREFLLDGGYYPTGGIQKLPDALTKVYKSMGGMLLTKHNVQEIVIKNASARGVKLNNSTVIKSHYVVAACDAHNTFISLIKSNGRPCKIMHNRVKKLKVASSGFIVYIGSNSSFDSIPCLKSNIFLINNFNLKQVYSGIPKFKNTHLSLHTPSALDRSLTNNGRSSLWIATNADYTSSKIWTKKLRNQYARRLIKIAEDIVPHLSDRISFYFTATPVTFHKWTNNFHGSAFGWASSPAQYGSPDTTQKTLINNLYITGHWSNQSSGVSFVAHSGRVTARQILQNRK